MGGLRSQFRQGVPVDGAHLHAGIGNGVEQYAALDARGVFHVAVVFAYVIPRLSVPAGAGLLEAEGTQRRIVARAAGADHLPDDGMVRRAIDGGDLVRHVHLDAVYAVARDLGMAKADDAEQCEGQGEKAF